MHYFVGDIHGYLDNLVNLFGKLEKIIADDDVIVFLGDYIDRGPQSYEVIDYLIYVSKKYNTIFLLGNHEAMFLKYIVGDDENGIYMLNGGLSTIKSYKKHQGKFIVPEYHRAFFDTLKLYYEGEDFIAVHAGLNPKINTIEDHDARDLIWIRESFFLADHRWEKTVIFGHTPTITIPGNDKDVYFDSKRNIIGIDSGVIYGKKLTCLTWPDRKIIRG